MKANDKQCKNCINWIEVKNSERVATKHRVNFCEVLQKNTSEFNYCLTNQFYKNDL